MSPTPEAVAHMEARARLVEATGRAARGVWRQIDRDHLYLSWVSLMARLLAIVSGGQLAAARGAEPWLEDLLGRDPARPESHRLNPMSLVGVDGAGRPLANVLMSPVWAALRLIAAGQPVAQAVVQGQALLDVIVQTAVADAGRAADQVAMSSRPAVKTYVRVVEAGACSRCVILGGVESSVSRAFQRHPRCKCSMEPVTADHKPTAVSPKALFEAMSPEQRRKTFGVDGAKAIENGADIGQVVNARRGMSSSSTLGGRAVTTTEGTARGLWRRQEFRRLQNEGVIPRSRSIRGFRPTQARLMPEEIFRQATDRDHAIRLLTLHGYIA